LEIIIKVKKKQEKLKFWISKFGWSQNEFARSFYVANNETDVETEIKSFEEKFKKHLSRTTTKEEIIDKYLDFIYSSDEFKKIGFIKPQNQSHHEFTFDFSQKMKKISKKIHDNI
jgi:hypothetical protein